MYLKLYRYGGCLFPTSLQRTITFYTPLPLPLTIISYLHFFVQRKLFLVDVSINRQIPSKIEKNALTKPMIHVITTCATLTEYDGTIVLQLQLKCECKYISSFINFLLTLCLYFILALNINAISLLEKHV